MAPGYSGIDLVTTFFKVLKTLEALPEPLRLECIAQVSAIHMRVVDGVGTLLQMQGLCAKLAGIVAQNGGPVQIPG